MSEPQPAMEQAEQNKLTRQVGRALLTVAPPDWTELRAEYRSAGRHIEVDVFVSGPDRTPVSVRPPMEVVEGLGRLRQGMYRPGRGTWLSATYTLEPPSSYTVDYDPDTEPAWRRLPPPIGFQDELRFFPRDETNIPNWFRHRAGLPPLPDPTQPDTPPAGMPAADPGTPQPAAAGQPPQPPAGPGQPPAQPGEAPPPAAPPSGHPQSPGQPAVAPPAHQQPPPGPPVPPPPAYPPAAPSPAHQQPPGPPVPPPPPGWDPQPQTPPAWTPPRQN